MGAFRIDFDLGGDGGFAYFDDFSIAAKDVTHFDGFFKLDGIDCDGNDSVNIEVTGCKRACNIDLRHNPSTKDVARGVGVFGHSDDFDAGFSHIVHIKPS